MFSEHSGIEVPLLEQTEVVEEVGNIADNELEGCRSTRAFVVALVAIACIASWSFICLHCLPRAWHFCFIFAFISDGLE